MRMAKSRRCNEKQSFVEWQNDSTLGLMILRSFEPVHDQERSYGQWTASLVAPCLSIAVWPITSDLSIISSLRTTEIFLKLKANSPMPTCFVNDAWNKVESLVQVPPARDGAGDALAVHPRELMIGLSRTAFRKASP
jgi:hypothetical protein